MRFLVLGSSVGAIAFVAWAAHAADKPAPVAGNPPAGSVILRAEPFDVTVKSLKVLRQMPIASIRSKPIVTIGTTQLNFKPMLDNRLALFNIAANLRKLPDSVAVVADETTALEIDQGVVVRSTLTYRFKLGACGDAGRRAKIESVGVGCRTKLTDAALGAALANKSDAHYIADPARRATAFAEAKKVRAESGAQVAADIAELRASLKDPSKRTQIEAEVGAAQAAKLSGLNDEQLALEMVNSAETNVEEIMYIPKNETLNANLRTSPFSPRNAPYAGPATPPPGKKSAPPAPPMEETVVNLDTKIFLTGFTLGRSYEWGKRVQVTIKWCVVGCKKTYYGEVFAKIGLGFGLRFPLQISGLYKHRLEGGQESATVTANFEPIDANADEYAMSGLPKAQLFDGKEIVAEAYAGAGVKFKIPFFGERTIPIQELGSDYTKALPAPFTNGQFKPPAPGDSDFPELTKKFDDADLLLGVANWGAFGAKVFPAVKAELHSTSLRFKLYDMLKGEQTWLTSSGQTVSLDVNPGDHSSRFSLGSPEYGLNFRVTPGLTGRLFVDVSVWSDHWDYETWFPQVALQLPPGGATFACHEGTTCLRSYNYSPTFQSEKVGPASPTELAIQNWKFAFEKEWKPQCPDQECKGGIGFIALTTGIYEKKLADDQFAEAKATEGLSETLKVIAKYEAKIQKGWQDAENQAAEVLEKAKIRKSKGQRGSAGNSTPPSLKRPPISVPPVAVQERSAAPVPAPAPPALTPVREAPAVQKSTLCRFTSGPRAGQVQDYAPIAAIPVGSTCQDGQGSAGRVIAPEDARQSDARQPEPPQKSTLCLFDAGPRAGERQDYAPMAPIPVGSSCRDGRGSTGRVVAP